MSALLMATLAVSAEKVVESPNGRLTVDLTMEDGVPYYQVVLDGQTFIQPSALGLITNIGDFSRDLTLKEVTTNDVKDEYALRNIKQSHVSYEACEAVAHFAQKGQPVMDVTFRVSNRDVALRYTILPKKARGGDILSCVVNEEKTAFKLPGSAEQTDDGLCTYGTKL